MLLLCKLPNYDIQIGVRHFLVSPVAIEIFRMIDYAIAVRTLQFHGRRTHRRGIGHAGHAMRRIGFRF